MTVNVPSHPFGESSVNIDIKTQNGYTDSANVGTAGGIAVDSKTGNVYVADEFDSRVQKFNTDGTFITKWGSHGTAD